MILDLVFVVAGLVMLLAAGEMLVRGAVGLAARLGVPSLLIGLTIVAFGTSAPELVVSIQAVLVNDNGIAIGNIIGSNIANILLVLGLPAILTPITLQLPGLRRHTVVMIVATLAFMYVVYGRGVLDTPAGIAMVAGIVIYVIATAVAAMRGDSPEKDLIESEVLGELGDTEHPPSPFKVGLLIVLGLIGLPIGATLLVNAGASLAESFGVREELIGLTIVAFGTSLPELATVLAAARKGEADVACGNIVGSNIFNILFVGGALGLFGTTAFEPATKAYDVPVMAVCAAILAIMVFGHMRITRAIGAIFLAAYVSYIVIIGAGASPAIAG